MIRRLSKLLLILVSALIGISGYSQPDSCHLRISLLTCSPGEELYSSFGHTALRVTDQSTGSDLVFNYGTFDDSDPYFYLKFTRGLMLYALSVYPYTDFQWEYKMQNRSVIEQELQLTCEEKRACMRCCWRMRGKTIAFTYIIFWMITAPPGPRIW